ncbi:MAG: BlaI/MecI/CopY family transcriptional regulator [Candidatus Izemoplasmatales bacterium]|nr:BlaI/MecI/CopY family transcriptional regulator [Candidatus Izemoplasmatales bacterium]
MQHITDSEWQIMRILWEKHSILATEVASILHDSKNWSLTTVKTFLSRLVKKEMVRYEKRGKVFLYTALFSERDCVIAEMKQVLKRIYGGKINYETEHFSFYGVPNLDLITRLGAHYEETYQRISMDYQYRCDEKQMVYLYASQSRLHSTLGLSIGPAWLRAGWEWEIIHLAPEDLFTDISIDSAAIHVWMQRVIYDINPLAPYWLRQGIAAFESELLKKERLESVLKKASTSIRPQTIENLSNQFDLFREQSGYELSYTVIQMIIDQFGKESLNIFIHNHQDYMSAFGMSSPQFWTKWASYCKSQYGNGGNNL